MTVYFPIKHKNQIKFLITDLDDYLNQCEWRWWVSDAGYAVRSIALLDTYNTRTKKYKSLKVRYHREILSLTSDDAQQVDHINGNRLDNRRGNLRLCTKSENACNRTRVLSKSGFKGVHFIERVKRYTAKIQFKRKSYHIGCFATAEEAALAYNDAAIKLHGQYARLNKV